MRRIGFAAFQEGFPMFSYSAQTGFVQPDPRAEQISMRRCIAVIGGLSLALWTVVAVVAVRLV